MQHQLLKTGSKLAYSEQLLLTSWWGSLFLRPRLLSGKFPIMEFHFDCLTLQTTHVTLNMTWDGWERWTYYGCIIDHKMWSFWLTHWVCCNPCLLICYPNVSVYYKTGASKSGTVSFTSRIVSKKKTEKRELFQKPGTVWKDVDINCGHCTSMKIISHLRRLHFKAQCN